MTASSGGRRRGRHSAPTRRRLLRASTVTRVLPLSGLALLCYVPLLFTAPGEVGADTKSYLYLDPGRLLRRAVSMWDPHIGLGTVSHQTIGYIWPMGPWYWLFDTLRVPDWVAQRLWLGTILFAAGAGVWFLLRTLRWDPLACTIAAFVYALTPYTLALASRISVILLPFAGLPWMLAFTIRAIRNGGWRDPALFALVVMSVGGVNATALVFAGVAPLLWFPFAVWVEREVSLRQAATAFLRIGVLTLVTSLWWISGLIAQGSYGIDILRYTETAKVVAAASVAPEVLRSLGYWFFYGGDRLGPWIEPGRDYTQRLWVLAVTYLSPLLAFIAATVARWKHRAYFVALVAVGTFIAVGAYPWDDPPLTGQAFKALLLSDKGLALRSTPRAVPLLTLGLAVLLSAGFVSVVRARPRLARPLGAGLLALAVAGLPPLWTGGLVAGNLSRPETLPSYWTAAASYLDSRGSSTRVLELPGSDFASYRWGNTVDPITPGLMDRPYVARELIPYGSPPSADLLNAFDRRLQENVLDPQAVAAIARIMGVGDVVARNDLQYERFRIARPYDVVALAGQAPGLGSPTTFGPVGTNDALASVPLRDEAFLRDAAGITYAPVAAYPVQAPEPIVRTAATQGPVMVAGSGEGLVELAAAGLIDGHELLRYSASLAADPVAVQAELDRGAALVLTDSNRRRGVRWSTVRDNVGYTEQAGESPLRTDLTDNRLPVFPGATDDSFTVSQHSVVWAQATSYGNPITFTPENRPQSAVDGDPRTAWKTGAFSDVRGEKLVLHFDTPVDTDHLRVLQPINGFRNRSITAVDLRFDGGDTARVNLDDSSVTEPGQVVTFPRHTFSTLELTIAADSSGRTSSPGRPARFGDLTSVGFAEVDVDGRHGDEVVRLPTDLLASTGAASLDHPLSLVLARQRTDAAETVRDDEETSIARTWSQPTARTFVLGGDARISPRVPDDVIDTAVGELGPQATSTRRLPGDIAARASSAIDGDPNTWWSPAFDVPSVDDSLTFALGSPVTVSHLDLAVVADGNHSIPTRLRVEGDDSARVEVAVPNIADGSGLAHVPIDLPKPISGSTLRFTFVGVRDVLTTDWYSNAPVRMPLGIAELGVPELSASPPVGTYDSGCRSDLLTVDGRAVSLRLTGSADDLLHRRPVTVQLCGADEAGIELGAGDHVLRTAKGLDTGIDLDRLVLQSAVGGAAATKVGPVRPASTSGAAAPVAHVDSEGATSFDITVSGATPGTPFWMVLGQSENKGWEASVDGASLGGSALVDGYANGWVVTPGAATVKVHLQWTPQRMVWGSLLASLAGAILCIGLALRRPRRARAGAGAAVTDDPLPETLVRRWVFGWRGSEPSGWASTLTALGVGVLWAAVIGPIAGFVVGLLTFIAARRQNRRWLLALGAPTAFAIAAGYVIAHQAKSRPTSAFEWPGEQAAVHQLAWVAVALVVSLVIVERLWDRPKR
ncbi:MAG: arabinofuranan 3-O-arabinosyltransferase [Acidimicrobiaceae bacterium]